LQRLRGSHVPQIYGGQCTGKRCFTTRFAKNNEPVNWTTVRIRGLEMGESMIPELRTTEQLLKMQELKPYVFASQYQGEPMDEATKIFYREDFPLVVGNLPEFIATAITIDCSATVEDYNDKTSFTFGGVHKLEVFSQMELELLDLKTQIGLCIINNWEFQCEPADVEQYFMSFYSDCLASRLPIPDVYIEEASVGRDLYNRLKRIPGIKVFPIVRTVASGSKTQRLVDCQPYVRKRLVSFPAYAPHTERCIAHMCDLQPDGKHEHDDIGDTIADQIHLAYMSEVWLNKNRVMKDKGALDRYLANQFAQLDQQRYM